MFSYSHLGPIYDRYIVDVCSSSTDSVNNNNDNRHFLLFWLQTVDGGPKQDGVVCPDWNIISIHEQAQLLSILTVKNLIPRSSVYFMSFLCCGCVSRGIIICRPYIRQ